MSLMELEFGFKKRYILAKYGDVCSDCQKRKAKIYMEGSDRTTFVLCEECVQSWIRILMQDYISSMYPDVSRKTLVERGIADRFLQRMCEDVKQSMTGSG